MKVRLPSKQPSPVQETHKAAREFNQDNIFKGVGLNHEDLNEEGNLNIRANMRPGHGIVYKEDNYRDSGPEYMAQDDVKSKYSLE